MQTGYKTPLIVYLREFFVQYFTIPTTTINQGDNYGNDPLHGTAIDEPALELTTVHGYTGDSCRNTGNI